MTPNIAGEALSMMHHILTQAKAAPLGPKTVSDKLSQDGRSGLQRNSTHSHIVMLLHYTLGATMKRRSALLSMLAIAGSLLVAPSAFADDEKLDVVVSIIPQKSIVESIGGDYADVSVMVPPGMHPRTFEPSPTQMVELESADLYIALGVPHEKNWMPQVTAARPDLPVLNLPETTTLRTIAGRVDASGGEMPDPHIWLAAPPLRDIAIGIRDELIKLAPEHADTFKANTEAWLARLNAVDAEAAEKLAPHKGKAFLVYHPAWGYVADSYGLRQIAIEQQGMEPGPKMIADAIDIARAENIKVVFAQQQFSQKEAETIAQEIGGKVVKLDPLNPDPIANLSSVADALAASFE